MTSNSQVSFSSLVSGKKNKIKRGKKPRQPAGTTRASPRLNSREMERTVNGRRTNSTTKVTKTDRHFCFGTVHVNESRCKMRRTYRGHLPRRTDAGLAGHSLRKDIQGILHHVLLEYRIREKVVNWLWITITDLISNA